MRAVACLLFVPLATAQANDEGISSGTVGFASTISGGYGNTAISSYGSVAGGYSNIIDASAYDGAISGGAYNLVRVMHVSAHYLDGA